MERIAQLVTVLLIFIVVLFLTYITTKLVAGFAKQQNVNRNIDVIESNRVAPSKFIAIVRVGKRYLALGIGKDEITYLTELSEDELEEPASVDHKNGPFPNARFQELLKKAGTRLQGKNDENHDGGGK